MTELSTITGLLATLVGVSAWLPQLAKIFKLREAHGFSTLTLVISSISVVTWLSYSLQVADKEQLLVNCFMILVNLLIAFFLNFKTLITVFFSKIIAFCVFFLMGDSTISGLAGTILICSIFLPQLVTILRKTDLLGISKTLYYLQVTQSTLWLVHSISGDYTALIFPNAFLIVLSVVILVSLNVKAKKGQQVKETA